MKRVLTKKKMQYIRDNYLHMSDVQIGKHLDVPKGTVKSFRLRENLNITKEEAIARRQKALIERHAKTEHHHDDFIKDVYLDMVPQKIADEIGRSEVYVKGRMQKLGLIIPPEIIEQRKQMSRIQPGNVPMNKGKKWDDFMSKAAQKRSRSTTFKKGNLPHNTLHDGKIVTRQDSKSKRRYQWIRISKANWKMLHVKIWEDANGPVPEGHCIMFIDGNSMNTALENLRLISNQDKILMNSIHNLPGDLKDVIMLRGRVKRKINILKNKGYGKQ